MYLKETQVAEMLQVSISTLQKWRMANTGPRFYRFGQRIIRYLESDIKNYREAHDGTTLEPPDRHD